MEPSILLRCRSVKSGKIKAMAISLDGLLDYDETDKDEATFELSLFAESFNELLMRDFGKLALESFIKYRASKLGKKSEDKRERGVEQEDHEPVMKKPKQAETPCELDPIVEETGMVQPSPTEAMDVNIQESNTQEVPLVKMEDDSMNTGEPMKREPEISKQVDEVMTKERTKEEVVVNEELLFAFRYFDRAGCGYIKCDDLRRLLHNLGSCLAPRVVRELVHGAAAIGKEKHKLDRVYYKYLTDKESPQ